MGHLKQQAFFNGGYIWNNQGKEQKIYRVLGCDDKYNFRCNYLCMCIWL